ncbi:hypothetical protein QL285_026082 [Trifolium repens]|nr:hypothetical protein QL285_026082 [Trifolium repens]
MHECGQCLTVFKVELLQKLYCIFALMNVSAIFSLIDLNPKEELQFTHHAHLKFILHQLGKILAQGGISRTKYYIFNIYLNN